MTLFLERARAARPGFELDAETARLRPQRSPVRRRTAACDRARAAVNVLGLAELLSLVERRVGLFHRQAASDAGGALANARGVELRPLARGREDPAAAVAVHRGGSSLPSLVAAGERHGLDEATVTLLLEALVDKSIITVSFPDGGARYTLLDTVRDYAVARLEEAGGLAAARSTHAAYFAALAERAREELRGSGWLASMRRLELENDNFWAAMTWAETRPTRPWPCGWRRRSGGTSRFPSGCPRGGDSWSWPWRWRMKPCRRSAGRGARGAVLSRGGGARRASGAAAGEEALALARASTASAALTMAQMTLAVAAARSGDLERSAALAEAARRGAVAARDDWAAAASGLIRAQSAAAAGDVETVATMAADVIAHADAIAYDAFQVPGTLLRDGSRPTEVTARPPRRPTCGRSTVAERSGLADHAAFAFAGLGSTALAAGNLRRAEQLLRQALAAAEAARAAWVAAHARVELGRVLAAAGDDATAERLYRTVLDWSTAPASPPSAGDALHRPCGRSRDRGAARPGRARGRAR